MKITHLIYINGYSLAVFYTSNSWRYSIILPNFSVFSPSDIFNTQDAAEYAGRYIIQNLLFV